MQASEPWPWWVAGPAIGLFVPALLLVGNKLFGVSSSLRHVCSALVGGSKLSYFRYDLKSTGLWNILFVAGILLGGFLASAGGPHTIAISDQTHQALAHLGIRDFSGVAPSELFSWAALFSWKGFVSVVVGGLLVGFGTAYAGGCTSGHAISGLADLQPASLIAVVGFFIGGLVATYFLLPLYL